MKLMLVPVSLRGNICTRRNCTGFTGATAADGMVCVNWACWTGFAPAGGGCCASAIEASTSVIIVARASAARNKTVTHARRSARTGRRNQLEFARLISWASLP
jgi:hypothetical protein